MRLRPVGDWWVGTCHVVEMGQFAYAPAHLWATYSENAAAGSSTSAKISAWVASAAVAEVVTSKVRR